MTDCLAIERKVLNNNPLSLAVENALGRSLAKDSNLSEAALRMEGMSGRSYRLFINNLVGSIPQPGYLEVGCWYGSTACAAMAGNDASIICVDDWSGFGGPKEGFFANIDAIRPGRRNFRFIECDFRKLDFGSIGTSNIYLFDGPHDFQDQYDGLTMALSALDKNFVFIVDDWNWPQVRLGTMTAIQDSKLEVISSIAIRTTLSDNLPDIWGPCSDWHNGYFIAVLAKPSGFLRAECSSKGY